MKNTMQNNPLNTTLLAALAPVGLAGIVSMMVAGAAWAQPSGGQQPSGGERRGPPAEAVAACKSLASGDACSFSGPQGNVSGTCFAPQQGLALACRPKDAPARGGATPRSK